MNKVCCCFLLTGLALSGQTAADPQAVARLTPVLSRVLVSAESPDDQVSKTLVNAMLSLAVREQQPTRQELGELARALRGAMAGRVIADSQLSVLSRCIVDVLHPDGMSNFMLASQVREVLTTLRVGDTKADLIVRRFVAVGEAVRGPDDLPARDNLNLAAPPRLK
jgi:hypothetical protein